MKFNYSYRAFLITSLLFGCLFLLLWSIKLSSDVPEELENYDVEYTQLEEELPQPPEEVINEQVAIQTNKAYNEAEKFLNDLNNPGVEESTTEEKLAELEAAIQQGSQSAANEGGIEKKPKETAKTIKKTAAPTSGAKGADTRTTISYRLVDRKAMQLPNPVYICEGGGKVVINIEVDESGRVQKASYNKSASTTSNGCLIDSALEYANQSKFTTAAGKKEQLGTITYNFPGQN